MQVDITVESAASNSIRARQVSSMFDAPISETCKLNWTFDFPYEDQPWNVGLIVGPSGSGKSTILRHVFGEEQRFDWAAPSVIDTFDKTLKIDAVASACQAVGFNTIPAWMRPYHVLSNGEKFRVELARRLLETKADTIVVDEFTSVVDRQVAQIGSHAVQKHVRRNGQQFVAASCHYDIIDWLQPDWVLDVASRQFTRRLLQRRPSVECVIGPLPYSAWSLFAPYHYLTGELQRGAKCWGLWANGHLASFAGLGNVPVSRGKLACTGIAQVSRLVTLPDWQGLGFAMVLVDALGAEHVAVGKRLRTYPAHPALIRSFDKSPNWSLKKRPGEISSASVGRPGFGQRPCAVFEYVGVPSSSPRLFR
jgi:ABC-type ATPase involved in cell division